MARPVSSPVLDVVTAARILPVVVIDDPAAAAPLGAALAAGGLPLAEVTLRTPGALNALRELARNEELVVGAGTVISVEQVDAVAEAGARFVVSPGFSAEVVQRCREVGLPVFPGVATATEIQSALREG